MLNSDSFEEVLQELILTGQAAHKNWLNQASAEMRGAIYADWTELVIKSVTHNLPRQERVDMF